MNKNPKTKYALGKDYRPLCIISNKLLAYQKEKLYLIDTTSDNAEYLCDLIIDDPRRKMCFFKFGERLSHISAYCGIQVDGGAVIAFNRGIYFVDIKTGNIKREFDFKLPDMRRPLNFYSIKDIAGFDDMILCPDYSFNKLRNPANIYSRNQQGEWKSIYSFPKGCIRHIHSIIPDPYRERVLILTGDFGDECALWEAKNNFQDIRKIVGSKQKYRACCAKAYPEGVVIVTDSPFDQNYVYIVKEKDDKVEIEQLAETLGPTVFFTEYKDKMVFATDVEYDEAKVQGPIRYISYRRGKGVKDWYTHLYIGSPESGFSEVERYKKDIWPMVTLGFATISFPNGQTEGKIYYYPTAVKKYDRKLLVLKV